MVTKDHIIQKLKQRLERKCNAIELTHWAKAIMFNYFEGKQSYDPAEKDLLERAVLRIANSSTNYRTFLFDQEILKLLVHLGTPTKYQPPEPELYSINIILGQQNSSRSKEAIAILTENLINKSMQVRQQGSGTVIVADHISAEEVHKIADLLQPHSFIMSLKDFSPNSKNS